MTTRTQAETDRDMGTSILAYLRRSLAALVIGAVLAALVLIVVTASYYVARDSRQTGEAVLAEARSNEALSADTRDAIDLIRDCLDRQGPRCGAVLAAEQAERDASAQRRFDGLSADVAAAIDRLTILGHQNQEQARQISALLAELVAARSEVAQLRSQVDRLLSTPVPTDPRPPATAPPPSSALCTLLGPLGAVLGC